MISAVARALVRAWDSLNKFTKWTIEQIAGSAIVEAIKEGYSATVEFLKDAGSTVVNAIGNLLGL